MRIEEFKAAVGKFPTGVTVISTNSDNKLYGFTANSFTSVSLVPNLVSFCLDQKAGSFKAFFTTNSFGISILSQDQKYISRHFASSIIDKFAGINYYTGSLSQAPFINGAICFLECKKYKQIECGDHYIFVGEVKRATVDNTKSPLIYFAKSYKGIK